MIKKIAMFAFAAILVVGLTGCEKLQARDNLNKGVRAFKDNRFDVAVGFFKEAMRLDPTLTNAELYLATSYAQQYIPGALSDQNLQFANEAIGVYETVLQREPNNVSAIKGLASIYMNLKDYPRAREYYMRNAELDPQDAESFYAVGSLNWNLIYYDDEENPLPDEEQIALIEQGLTYVDQALVINPLYDDAMVYKNLLYRQKARFAATPEEEAALTAEADRISDLATETRRQNAERGRFGVVAGQ